MAPKNLVDARPGDFSEIATLLSNFRLPMNGGRLRAAWSRLDDGNEIARAEQENRLWRQRQGGQQLELTSIDDMGDIFKGVLTDLITAGGVRLTIARLDR